MLLHGVQLVMSQCRFLSIIYISTVYISTVYISTVSVFQRQDISTFIYFNFYMLGSVADPKYFYSDSDPAKSFGFFRIRNRSTDGGGDACFAKLHCLDSDSDPPKSSRFFRIRIRIRIRIRNTDKTGKLASRYYVVRMPGARDRFALPARLCLSYCLTRV
jgi:hypothetical protein